jgi:hypothetical protein
MTNSKFKILGRLLLWFLGSIIGIILLVFLLITGYGLLNGPPI